jgi:hypothetical protein
MEIEGKKLTQHDWEAGQRSIYTSDHSNSRKHKAAHGWSIGGKGVTWGGWRFPQWWRIAPWSAAASSSGLGDAQTEQQKLPGEIDRFFQESSRREQHWEQPTIFHGVVTHRRSARLMTSMLYVLELIDVVICEFSRNGRCLEEVAWYGWYISVLGRKEMYIGIQAAYTSIRLIWQPTWHRNQGLKNWYDLKNRSSPIWPIIIKTDKKSLRIQISYLRSFTDRYNW